jgi:hypothetical protein
LLSARLRSDGSLAFHPDGHQRLGRTVREIIPVSGGVARVVFTNGHVLLLKTKTFSTFYVHRPLQNADELLAWAKANGFTDTLAPQDLHVTIAFSKTPLLWEKFTPDQSILTVTPASTSVKPLGDKGAVVLPP